MMIVFPVGKNEVAKLLIFWLTRDIKNQKSIEIFFLKNAYSASSIV
jgi:hypothetical protein